MFILLSYTISDMMIGNPANRYWTVTYAAETQHQLAMAIKTCAKVKLCGIGQYEHFMATQSFQFQYWIHTHVWPWNLSVDAKRKRQIKCCPNEVNTQDSENATDFDSRSQTNQAVRDQATQYGVNLEKYLEIGSTSLFWIWFRSSDSPRIS